MDTESPPVVLKELSLVDIRCFERLTLKFHSRSRKKGQWTVLLGENGVGKTTILKSIVVALSSLSDLTRYPEGRLSRHGTQRGRVSLSDTHHNVDRDWDTGFYTQREKSRYPVFAYGAARGSALSGPDRSVDLDHPMGSISTLFNQPPGLVHAETWLRNLAFGALKNQGGEEESFYNAVIKTLVELLPGVETIEAKTSGIYLRGGAIGEVTLDGLSDGFITTIGWICDLIARWTHYARQNEYQLDGSFRKNMTGLVLVDELDLHLHPRWQMNVIKDLRKAFPKMSFVVTTHNPLTLLGARNNEIHVLERGADDVITVRNVDLPKGIRTDEILTGAWFGLTSTLDDNTQRKLAAYQRKVRDGASKEALRKDEIELRKRIPDLSYSREDRVARQLVSDVFEDDKPLTEDELTHLGAEMRKRLDME